MQLHEKDENGNPAGGRTTGEGIDIRWQNGPLGRGANRRDPNGAFVEGVIAAAAGRIEHYQYTQFHCIENAVALGHLYAALEVLNERTRAREDRDVEGTHTI